MVGALAAGALADLFSLGVAIQVVAALTMASGVVAAVTLGRRAAAVPTPHVEVST
jgi:hypothetical protein